VSVASSSRQLLVVELVLRCQASAPSCCWLCAQLTQSLSELMQARHFLRPSHSHALCSLVGRLTVCLVHLPHLYQAAVDCTSAYAVLDVVVKLSQTRSSATAGQHCSSTCSTGAQIGTLLLQSSQTCPHMLKAPFARFQQGCGACRCHSSR
jgi:hypothetical protein